MSEKDEKAEKKPKAPPVPVTVKGVEKQSALVEWVADGQLCRGYVPASSLKDGCVSAVTLGRSIPYGAQWQKAELEASAADLAQNLRKAGIWTKEDMAQKPNVAIGAIQATYRVDLGALMRLED